MKTIQRTIRENRGYSNYPKQITVTVDEKLASLIEIIDGRNYNKDFVKNDNVIYFYETGTMSKDSGFNMVDIDAKQTGQGIGLFYGGISKGQEYLSLGQMKDGGTYRYEDLIFTK